MEGYALRKAESAAGADEMSRDAFQAVMSEGRTEFIQRTIQEAGHDGVVYRNAFEGGGDSYIVFKPTQIKSATGNVGTYDPTDPRFAHGIVGAAGAGEAEAQRRQQP